LTPDFQYLPRMNWESIIKAYPSQAEVIQGIKTLREKIDNAMEGIDTPEMKTTFRELADLTEFVPLFSHSCATVWKDVTGSKPAFDMAEALIAAASGKDTGGMAGAQDDLFQAIMQNAFTRFLHLLREKNAHLIPESWSQGDCPFCGAYPRIGFDAEDKRTLHCLSCGFSWRFARFKCPSCGNTDFNTQGYFEAEGLEGVRVNFCRDCNRYLKIVDTRIRPPEDPESEDALTLELDDLAVKEGFV
jgi:formate dehydrogenase maturation protein FdhE